ncbi:uncharacterized protein TNCV_1727521 [Trichonephila clavipes]|nr:uncharacterized protein TNCV_1727521 [Trichonephila clavipes]
MATGSSLTQNHSRSQSEIRGILHNISSNPVPLKTRRVGEQCTLNVSRAQTSSRWYGVVVRREGYQLKCCPRHLTMVQNDVVRRQKSSCS